MSQLPKLLLAGTMALVTLSSCLPRQVPQKPAPRPEAAPLAHQGTWLLVDSKREQILLYKNDKILKVFDNPAFGAAGVGRKSRRGDDITPRGVFKVAWTTSKSKFVHFIGLDYPRVEDANRGLQDGVIKRREYEQIIKAHAAGAIPPQNTALGGLIGIHGVGKGSIEIHRLANWTAGCIALENNQIRELAQKLPVGTVVEIQ